MPRRANRASLSPSQQRAASATFLLPPAPGVLWPSLLIYCVTLYYFPVAAVSRTQRRVRGSIFTWSASRCDRLAVGIAIAVLLALLGSLGRAGRGAKFLRIKISNVWWSDECSGQFLAYAAALAPLNWKYLLLGFILFRAFDIWKPSPAREAESLPGGLGIMADDWVAGIYAAIGLWIARAAGL